MMKLLTLLLTLALAFSAAEAAGPYTTGPQANPLANTILADSGPRGPGGKQPAFVVCSTAGAAVTLEYRDADNLTNLYSQVFAVSANSCFAYTYPVSFDTLDQERFRIRLNTAITLGNIQASLFD